MEHNEYLKIKNKYEAVLFELMKEVSNKLSYEDCNILYKEWALTLITASLDLDRTTEDVMQDVSKFGIFMIDSIKSVKDDVDNGKYVGKIIKHYD